MEQGDTLLELSLPTAEAYHEQTKLALQQTDADYGVAKKQFQADVDVAKEVGEDRAAIVAMVIHL